MEGHNDITLGHMSLRDPRGRGLWLKKARRGLDEVFDAEDYVLIDFDGKLLEGEPCHSEWPIHTEIMKARPDVTVVGHTHAYYSVLFSAAEQELAALNHEGANLLGNLARFRETAGLINTVELGRKLAQSLGPVGGADEEPRHHIRRAYDRGSNALWRVHRARLQGAARDRGNGVEVDHARRCWL